MPFVKGQSGNPHGRRVEKVWRDAVFKAVNERAEDGQKYLNRIAQRLVLVADQGDVPAIKEIADRLDGKAVQQIAGDTDDGALVVKIVRLAAEGGNGQS